MVEARNIPRFDGIHDAQSTKRLIEMSITFIEEFLLSVFEGEGRKSPLPYVLPNLILKHESVS